jgi:chemotaxis protein MotB
MARARKQVEEDEAPGAPEWMVTFSDCMTLLLTFFVLLLSFSSFDDKTFRKLQMIFVENLPAIGESDKRDKDSVFPPEQIQTTVSLLEGSEKPTLDQGLDDNLQKETPADFRSRKVFSISSEKIFWGNGALISAEGRGIMTTMASFLKEVPNRVVICENGPAGKGGAEQLGLSRAWAVLDYFTSSQNLDKNWFSVSAGSTLAQEDLRSSESSRISMKSERTLEIVLLERSIYD